MISAADFRRQQIQDMSEDELQAQVESLARLFGWRFYHTHDSRRSPKGFPDHVLVHAKAGRLILAELKREKGRYRPGQREWLADLNAVADAILADLLEFTTAIALQHAGIRPRVTAVTWRPSDYYSGAIETTLQEIR